MISTKNAFLQACPVHHWQAHTKATRQSSEFKVSHWVLAVAQGQCQWCAEPAGQSGPSLPYLGTPISEIVPCWRDCATQHWETGSPSGCPPTWRNKEPQILTLKAATYPSILQLLEIASQRHFSLKFSCNCSDCAKICKKKKKIVKKRLWLISLLSGLLIVLLPRAFIPSLINTDQCTDLHALALDLQSYDWIPWKPDAQKGVSTSMWSLLLHVPEWPPILVVISPDAETSSRFGGRTDAVPCWTVGSYWVPSSLLLSQLTCERGAEGLVKVLLDTSWSLFLCSQSVANITPACTSTTEEK